MQGGAGIVRTYSTASVKRNAKVAYWNDLQCTLFSPLEVIPADHETFDAEREVEEVFDYFADRVLTGGEIYADGRHGLADMRIIEAIHRAADEGEPVDL